ncbi:hypothetical protein ACFE04_020912 [Oxalis oulophora]
MEGFIVSNRTTDLPAVEVVDQIENMDLTAITTTVTKNRDISLSLVDEDGVLSVNASLAKDAAVLFQSRKFDECLCVLNQLLEKKNDDPEVLVRSLLNGREIVLRLAHVSSSFLDIVFVGAMRRLLALELDNEDTSYLTNRAAIYLEMGDVISIFHSMCMNFNYKSIFA